MAKAKPSEQTLLIELMEACLSQASSEEVFSKLQTFFPSQTTWGCSWYTQNAGHILLTQQLFKPEDSIKIKITQKLTPPQTFQTPQQLGLKVAKSQGFELDTVVLFEDKGAPRSFIFWGSLAPTKNQVRALRAVGSFLSTLQDLPFFTEELRDTVDLAALLAQRTSLAERELARIFNSVSDVIWSMDYTSEHLLFTNEAGRQLFDLNLAEDLGTLCFPKDFLEDSEVERYNRAMQSLQKQGYAEVELRVLLKSGTVHWLRTRLWKISGRQGQGLRINGIATDITMDRMANSRLKIALDQHEALIDALPDSLLLIDTTLCIRFARLRPAEHFSHKGHQLVGLPIRKLALRSEVIDVLEEQMKATLADGHTRQVQLDLHLPGEPLRYYEAILNASESRDEIICILRDVSRNRIFEKALGESKAQLKALFDASTYAYLLVSSKYRVLTFNKKAGLGFANHLEKGLYEGINILSLLPQEFKTQFVKLFSDLLQGGTSNVRLCLRRRHWYDIQLLPVYTEKHQLVGVGVIAEEVTRELITKRRLQESELLFRLISENSQDVISLHEADGKMLYCSPAVERILGYTPLELKDKAFQDFIHPLDQWKFTRNILEPILMRKSAGPIEYRFKHKNGNYLWLQTLAQPVHKNGSETPHWQSSSRDITAQRQQEDRFKAVFEESPNALVLTDIKGSIHTVNFQAEKIFQRRGKELVGLGVWYLFMPSAIVNPPFSSIREVENGLVRIPQQNSSPRFAELSIRALQLEESTMLLLTLEDVTENQKKAEDLRRLTQDLIVKNENLEQFAYITSHNLRAPVANILGLINIFNVDKPDDSFNLKLIQLLREATQKLNEVIFNLNYTLDIKNNVQEVRERVDLDELVSSSVTLLNNQVKASNASMEVRFSPQCIYTIRGYVRSILHNLISNAIKYKHPLRAPKITILGEVCHHKGQRVYKISVKDNGLGLNTKNLDGKLFGLYQRFHTHTEGKGMGLHLVKTQVEALGGEVAVESTPNLGATFFLYLPETVLINPNSYKD